ncbi:MAG: primosomal protein N' [Brevinematia bacterium]
MFAEVLVNIPTNETFWYQIEKPHENIKKYTRVDIIFSQKNTQGLILDISPEPKGKRLGKIRRTIDKEEVFSDEQMELAKFISEYFTATLSETVFSMIPNGSRLNKISEPKNLRITENTTLTSAQEKVYQAIKSCFGKNEIFLLYGVAGSGKTEIYKKLIKDILNQGKSALLLVPEISLTPQFIDKFSFIPREIMAVYHSKLTDNERFNTYMSAKKGIKRLIIGPRSSIFLPLKNLGIIIIDEFHETSYKSSSTPRYSTKDIAKWIARKKSIPLVLGSATPPVEDFYLAKQGVYKLLELREKFSKHQRIETEIVDMKSLPKGQVISPRVISEINDKLRSGQQVIVFINRRGFSNFVKCGVCGFVPTCPNCDITLTYHKFKSSLECHYCGYKENYTELCPKCSKGKVFDIGLGTEKAEEIIRNTFLRARVVRVDLDTTREKDIYEKIYSSLKKGDIDIIVGTQIITKGLDIPQVNLVCVLFPEIVLRLPDFYSSERTFSLILQALGRAGRRDEVGKGIIQTSDPEHYSIKTATLQNYEEFYNYEIARRDRFNYPPFTFITRFIFRSEVEKNCLEIGRSAKILLDSLSYKREDTFISPLLPAPIKKISKNYRYQIVVKSKSEELITKAQKTVFENLAGKKGVYIEIDRNPLSLL